MILLNGSKHLFHLYEDYYYQKQYLIHKVIMRANNWNVLRLEWRRAYSEHSNLLMIGYCYHYYYMPVSGLE